MRFEITLHFHVCALIQIVLLWGHFLHHICVRGTGAPRLTEELVSKFPVLRYLSAFMLPKSSITIAINVVSYAEKIRFNRFKILELIWLAVRFFVQHFHYPVE